ncbi:MAG: hypothetical protein KF906_09315 [Actinobacteria bacterium]|nr:hypothetical protein [Actinomycetota bacterium]
MDPQVIDAIVDVDYGQFYAMRSGSSWASDRVPSQGYEDYLWSDGAFVYIGTTRRYGKTNVRIEMEHEAPEGEPSRDWHHVAEVSLDPGGDLEVYSWGDDSPAATVPLDGSAIRLRVCWRGLVSGRFEGLDEEGKSDEELLIQLWPAEPADSRVTRWWDERLLPAPTDRSPDGRRQFEGLERVMEQLSQMTIVGNLSSPYPPMPGGGEHSTTNSVHTDPSEGSWWVDGYDVRRTLREVSEEEARHLLLGASGSDLA